MNLKIKKIMSKENFKITSVEDGQEYWISRSAAVAIVIYCFSENGSGSFLIHKRGKGCPDNIGAWSCNCGYINWGERIKRAAVREVYEEIGLRLNPNQLVDLGYNDPIDTENENITHRFFVAISEKEAKEKILSGEINNKTHLRGGEENEVESIYLLPATQASIESLTIRDGFWAFGHDKLLLKVLENNVYRD